MSSVMNLSAPSLRKSLETVPCSTAYRLKSLGNRSTSTASPPTPSLITKSSRNSCDSVSPRLAPSATIFSPPWRYGPLLPLTSTFFSAPFPRHGAQVPFRPSQTERHAHGRPRMISTSWFTLLSRQPHFLVPAPRALLTGHPIRASYAHPAPLRCPLLLTSP